MLNFPSWNRKKAVDQSPATSSRASTLDKSVRSQVAIIGAGKMGQALIHCWLAEGLKPQNLLIVEPIPSSELQQLTSELGIELVERLQDVPPSTVLFLAIKPQISDEVMPHLGRLVGNNTLIISIMAGKTIARITQRVNRNVAIVRAMPNLPATIGRGVTAAIANELVTQDQLDLADALLLATGDVLWIKDESLMDAVTAVSGSGPAYVFLLAESLARAGTAAGLPADLAENLARETVAGSGELLHRSLLSASALRNNVTSPGGTTAAALDVLMDAKGLNPLLEKAVAAAAKRSRELAD